MISKYFGKRKDILYEFRFLNIEGSDFLYFCDRKNGYYSLYQFHQLFLEGIKKEELKLLVYLSMNDLLPSSISSMSFKYLTNLYLLEKFKEAEIKLSFGGGLPILMSIGSADILIKIFNPKIDGKLLMIFMGFHSELLRAGGRKRTVTYKIRHNIARSQKYKCAKCSMDFSDDDFDVDHNIRFADGGVDKEINLQALCLKCHRQKTNSENGGEKCFKRFV